MSSQEPPQVAGISLSGNDPYTIDADENLRLCQSIGAVPDATGHAHPIFYYIATQAGMGKTVGGLCAACDFDVDDGPMMGTSKVTFFNAMLTDQPYLVTGQILGLVRKASRKLGVMDIVEYELHLEHPDGTRVLTTSNTWILPRRNLA